MKTGDPCTCPVTGQKSKYVGFPLNQCVCDSTNTYDIKNLSTCVKTAKSWSTLNIADPNKRYPFDDNRDACMRAGGCFADMPTVGKSCWFKDMPDRHFPSALDPLYNYTIGKINSKIGVDLFSKVGGSAAQVVQSQLVSYYRPSNKKWYTWSISGGGSLSGVRICGAGQLCGPLAGVTLSELEAKANAIGAQFVSATDNLPQGARNAGEIQESWYRSWWGLGLIAVGVGAVGYYSYKKRK